jgi:hypothetical protein
LPVFVQSEKGCPFNKIGRKGRLKKATYVGKTTVGATAYLRLVDVDEDARVAEGTAAAVALDGFLLDPADGLFVDELDGCQWARLCLGDSVSVIVHPLHLFHSCFLNSSSILFLFLV